MSDINLTCIGGGVFKASTAQDEELLSRFKLGDIMKAKVSRTRNGKFLNKYFALLNLAFDAFEPVVEYKGEVIKKNFERFRKDIIILSGRYTLTVDITGSPKAEAASISFSSMSEDEFAKLYSDTVDVILERVLTSYTREDIDNVVNQVMGFA